VDEVLLFVINVIDVCGEILGGSGIHSPVKCSTHESRSLSRGYCRLSSSLYSCIALDNDERAAMNNTTN